MSDQASDRADLPDRDPAAGLPDRDPAAGLPDRDPAQELPDRDPADLPDSFRRDRREHGGAPGRLDDDQLARLTEEERVEAGVDDYDPDEVPPATDEPVPSGGLTQTGQYQEERAEIRREVSQGELRSIDEQHPFPPSHYEDS
jgi:hypothetical protein